MLARWNVRQTAYSQIVARSPYFVAETHSPALSHLHNAQEMPIVSTTGQTIRGALAQAWLAWDAQGQVRNEDDRKRYALIHATDFDALADLERRKELDWDDSTMLPVIRSLRALAREA